MKTNGARVTRLLACILIPVSMAAACQSNEAPAGVDGKSTRQYRSVGKPTAAIDIRHTIVGKPELGEPVLVRVTVTPARGATELRLQLITDAGLSIDASDSSFSRRYGAEPEPATYEVWVTPLVEGLNYLTILATIDIDGRPQSRTSAVALQVDPIQRSVSKPGAEELSRETVISMPAVEAPN